MTQAQAFKCPSCNASLEYDGRSETIRCEFCGSTIIVPESMRAGFSQSGYMASQSPDQAASIHTILELVRQGDKIQAIKLYMETFGVGLKEAKDVVDHLALGQPTTLTITSVPTVTTSHNSGCGCLIGMIVLLVGLGVAVAGAVPFLTIGSVTQLMENPEQFIQQISEGNIGSIIQEVEQRAGSINRGMTGSPIPTTSGGDGLGADLLLENYRYSSSPVSIMLSYAEASENGRRARWETEVSDTNSSQQYNTGFDNRHVYVSTGTAVRALSRTDGAQVWQANLSDIIDRRCRGCLRSEEGVVVALTADNVLYGLDANTGQQRWQVRLESDNTRYLSEGFVGYAFLNNNVILLDRSASAGSFGFALKLYDLQTGELAQELVPACADTGNFFDPAPIGYYDQVFVHEGQDKLFLLYGANINGAYCLEQWDAAAGSPVWQTRLPGEATISSSIGGGMITEWSQSPAFAFDGETLLIPTYEASATQGMALADLGNGQIQFYLPEVDYKLWPIGVQGETAVVWAERQRGSTQISVWGLDAATGTRKWEHPLQATYLLELSPFDDQWTYHLTPDALYILQLFATPEPPELLVQSLGINNGALNYEVKNNLPDDYWQGIARTNDHIYLTLRSLVSVKLSTGGTAVEWP